MSRRWVCGNCGYAFDEEEGDPDNGIPPGSTPESLGADWLCPWCGSDAEALHAED